jgi:hypothetical protein
LMQNDAFLMKQKISSGMRVQCNAPPDGTLSSCSQFEGFATSKKFASAVRFSPRLSAPQSVSVRR